MMFKISCFILLIVILPYLSLYGDSSENESWIESAIREKSFYETEVILEEALNGLNYQLPIFESQEKLYNYLAEIQMEWAIYNWERDVEKKVVLIKLKQAEASSILSLEETGMLNPGFWKLLGRIRMKYAEIVGNLEALKKITEARDAYFQSLILDSNQSSVWGYLGDIYGNMPPIITFGNKRDAVSFARRSLMQNETESLWPLYRLSKLLYERNWSKRRRQNEYKKGFRIWSTSFDFIRKNGAFEFSELSTNWFYENFDIRFDQQNDRYEALILLRQLEKKAELAGIKESNPDFYRDIIELQTLNFSIPR